MALNRFVRSVYLLLIRVIGHKTSLSTSQVTATNLSKMTGALANHLSHFNSYSKSESRGGSTRRVFFKREEILRKCVGSRSVFPSRLGIIDKLIPLCDVSLWCKPIVRHNHGCGDRQVRGGTGEATVVRSKCRFSTRWNSWLTATGLQTRSPKISIMVKRRPTSRAARRRPTANRGSYSWG